MNISNIATIKTNMGNADFWIIRKGSLARVGEPTKSFYSEHFGLKLNEVGLSIFLPDYLFCVMLYVHDAGFYKPHGILKNSLGSWELAVLERRSVCRKKSLVYQLK